MSRSTADELSLHVHRFGDGGRTHYLAIHGWGGGWETFEPLAEHLSPDASIWSVDLPGYGDSQPLDDWRWETLAERVVQTARGLDGGSFQLIGNCSGACFGLGAAIEAPDLFERLWLIDPFAYFPWYFRMLVARGVGPLFYKTAFANPLGRWITNRSVADRTGGVHATRSFTDLDHDVVYRHLRMLQQLPELDEFAHLEMPVTMVYGEHTFDAVRESIAMWAELWPHARIVELPGVGHLPLQEAIERVAGAIFGGDQPEE